MKDLTTFVLLFLLVIITSFSNSSESDETKVEQKGTAIYETNPFTCFNNDCLSQSTLEEVTETTEFPDKTTPAVIPSSDKSRLLQTNKHNETTENGGGNKISNEKKDKNNTRNTQQKYKPKPELKPHQMNKSDSKVDKKQYQNNTFPNETKYVNLLKTKVKPMKTMPCNCDTTIGICEINCCCDEDCSKNDKHVFSRCEDDTNHFSSSDYCFPHSVMYKNNSPYKTFNFRPGLLCIARNNLPDKVKYYRHKILKNEQTIANILKKRKTFHWNVKNNEVDSELRRQEYYIHGSPIWFFRNTSEELYLQKFSIPHEGITSMCESQQTIGYLEGVKSTCLVKKPRNRDDCERSFKLNGKDYKDIYFLISAKLFNTTTDLESIYLDEIFVKSQISICSKSQCNETFNTPSPTYDEKSKTCKYVIQDVECHIKHNGTEGIIKVDFFLYLTDLSIGNGMFRKRFEIKFNWLNEKKNSFSKSGKPGYFNKKPLIISNKTEVIEDDKTREIFNFSFNPNNWLTVATANNKGYCTNKRNNIMFNENVKAECIMEVWNEDMNKHENCSKLSQKIHSYLHGSREYVYNTYISSWGDPRPHDSSAWVPLVSTSEQPIASCQLVTTAISYHFIYSFSGSVGSPQSTIIGAIMETTSSPFSCEESSRCLVKLITTVAFTSVTSIPKLTYPKHPTLRLHLPKDFFYPFSSSSSTANTFNDINRFLIFYTLQILLYKLTINF